MTYAASNSHASVACRTTIDPLTLEGFGLRVSGVGCRGACLLNELRDLFLVSLTFLCELRGLVLLGSECAISDATCALSLLPCLVRQFVLLHLPHSVYR